MPQTTNILHPPSLWSRGSDTWIENGMYFGLLEGYFIAFSTDGLWYSQRNRPSAGKQCHQNAHDVQLCDSYFMGLQVLQTFGFLRLNPNPGFGRQEPTAHEIKTIIVAGNNWGRRQKWCSPSGWREALPFVARLEKASWISRCFWMFQRQQELRVFISPSPICLVRRFQPLVLLDCVTIVCAFLISRLDRCHVVCSALRLRTTQKLQLIAVCSCLLTYPHFRHKP